MDLKCVLNEQEKVPDLDDSKTNETTVDDIKKEDKIRIHKKPMQLRDIENRSSGNNRKISLSHESDEKIKDLLQKEKNEVYKQTWNKLDMGMKINPIKEFINEQEKERNLTKQQKEKLKVLLIKECNENKLNKNTEVNYNKHEGKIISIKSLKYNEENGKYLLEISQSIRNKCTSTSKSKSNIDRFLKKK